MTAAASSESSDAAAGEYGAAAMSVEVGGSLTVAAPLAAAAGYVFICSCNASATNTFS